MRQTSAMAVLSAIILGVTISLPALLFGAPRDQAQAATTPNHLNMQLWKDPQIIEGLKDVLFDFDTHESASEKAILDVNAQWLIDHPTVRVKLAGYTDPQGDLVYNLALSQRRAETVKQELIQMGVGENRIVFATGWGELYPNCLESSEDCWKHNRRVEFVLATE